MGKKNNGIYGHARLNRKKLQKRQFRRKLLAQLKLRLLQRTKVFMRTKSDGIKHKQLWKQMQDSILQTELPGIFWTALFQVMILAPG